MPKSKLNIALFIGAFVLTLAVLMIAVKFRAWHLAPSQKAVFVKEGYDFRQKRLLNKEYLEPKLGSRINLADLQTSKREKLLSLVSGELLLLVVVDPNCPACEFSVDMIEDVRSDAKELGIKYLPIVFRKPPKETSIDLHRYAEGLGFESCVQSSSDVNPLKSLGTVGTPSHILTTRDGVVLQIWHGTSTDAMTRRRMSVQISSDLFLINDVLTAIKANG